MRRIIFFLLVVFIFKILDAQCTGPNVLLRTMEYCQNLGSAKLDSNVIKPTTKFGYKQYWRLLKAPGSVDTNGVVVDESGGYGTNWMFYFGKPNEDFYAGEYDLEFKVTNQITGCYTIDTTTITVVTEPKIKITTPALVCLNEDTIDLRNYVKLNDQTPAINALNKFTIIEYKNSRTDPKIFSTKLIQGYKFIPQSGLGSWMFKFTSLETGCINEDSFVIDVLDTPNVILKSPITICSSEKPLDLSSRIDKVIPPDAQITWSGYQVVNGTFTPQSKDNATFEGPYLLKCSVMNTGGCYGSSNYPVTVQSAPQIQFSKQWNTYTCASAPVQVEAIPKYSYLNQVTWSLGANTDGSFDYPNSNTPRYMPGSNSNANGRAVLIAKTIAIPNGACAFASDSLEIIIYPYPNITLTQPNAQCIPFQADFDALETSGIPDSNLVWRWNFGKGDTTLSKKVMGVLYDQQGKFDVMLTVSNKQGPCVTSIKYKDFVHAFPRPMVNFDSDPTFHFSDETPLFQMHNKSGIDTTVFKDQLRYLWDFGDASVHPNDTSTLENPDWTYSTDTGFHDIKLYAVSSYGCMDSGVFRVKIIAATPPPLIPNSFTPNSTSPGINDIFIPVIGKVENYSFNIMGRNGDVVFATTNTAQGWDGKVNGKDAPVSVYFYRVEYKNNKGTMEKFKGNVLLLR